MKRHMKILASVMAASMAFGGFSAGLPITSNNYSSIVAAAETSELNVGDFVNRCYQVALGRGADDAGYKYWVDNLNNGSACGAQVGYGFIFSQEYMGKNTDADTFIKDLYQMYFDRTPDDAGYQYWLEMLNNNISREEIFAGFANSLEFYNLCVKYDVVAGTYLTGVSNDQQGGVNCFVSRLYQVCFNRLPDMAGQAGWVQKLANKEVSGSSIAEGFIFSDEFTKQNLNNEDFVKCMYQAFFGREADDAGLVAWKEKLDSGVSRKDVFYGFAGSAEFDALCSKYGIVRGEVVAPTANPTSVPTKAPTSMPSTNQIAQIPGANLSSYIELEVKSVSDSGNGKILVYSWSGEVPGYIRNYSDVEFDYKIVDATVYQEILDAVLSSGDGAPDLFACDAVYASKYINSNWTLPINDLGISNSELKNMVNYTLQYACDDMNVIKGLSFDVGPCGVFYNAELTKDLLGVCDPEDVAPFFATWDAFMSVANLVNENSNGTVKIVSGTDDIWRAYLSTREKGWINNGKLYVDPIMEDYFDLTKTLVDEGLTFETNQWGSDWYTNMENHKVLSYWGPLWLPSYCFQFDSTNETAGEWRVVAGPSENYWGGTWIMASWYCQYKASAAQIMRDITLNEDNLMDMAQGGIFVNNVSVMCQVANDSTMGYEIFGGQNPVSVLYPTLENIDLSRTGVYDVAIGEEFGVVVSSYAHGDIDTVSEALKIFERNIEELGII